MRSFLWSEWWRKCWALHPGQWSLFNYSAETIRKLCSLGNAVVVGRAGNFVAADLNNTFHARVVGARENRTAYTASRYQVPLARARQIVDQTDKERKKFVRRYANARIDDSRYYHIVVNTDDLSTDSAARILAESMLDWAHERKSSGQNRDSAV